VPSKATDESEGVGGGREGKRQGIEEDCLDRQSESVDEGLAGVVDANDAEEQPEEDDEAVVGDGTRLHGVALELEVEVAGPDEGEHSAGEGADEAHEDAEVGYEDGHEDGEEDDADAPRQAPDLQLPVEGPDRREDGLGPAPEEGPLQELAGRVVGQGIGQQGLYDQARVHQALEARRVQVVRYFLEERLPVISCRRSHYSMLLSLGRITSRHFGHSYGPVTFYHRVTSRIITYESHALLRQITAFTVHRKKT
jgi:hypothetical protein